MIRTNFKILILGKGRIAKAIFHYLKKNKTISKIAFFTNAKEIKNYDLLLGTFAGNTGEESLKLALKFKKDLIDVADLEPEFYLKKQKQIKNRGITVIPGCGFCPGLVNLILGKEIFEQKNIKEIEIKAGTLSSQKFFYPFLWCFEDLILEHQIPSFQMISGKKTKFPAFGGYQEEKFYGIDGETYFAQSGFDNLMDELKIKNFKFRVIRPLGFSSFFQFLQGYGFFKKNDLEKTKDLLEKQKQDNLTLAVIKILASKKQILWQIKAFSKKKEKLNSMQKIAGVFPSIIAQLFLAKQIKKQRLLSMEKLSQDKNLFAQILKDLKKEGIFIQRKNS